ncbi:23360_t:CDS:1, partial [Racocetra persica]
MIIPEHIKNLDHQTQPQQSCQLCLKFLQYFIDHVRDRDIRDEVQNEKNYLQCSECNYKVFNDAFAMHQHKRDKHGIAVCKVCGKETGGFKKFLCEDHDTDQEKKGRR